MKKITLLTAILSLIFVSSFAYAQEEGEEIDFKNYNMASGIVKYQLSGIQKGTQELYFDEYGKYESKFMKGDYDYMGQKGTFNVQTTTTPDGGFQINLDKSQGAKFEAPDYTEIIELFEANQGNFDKVQEETMKKAKFIKKGIEKVLDKDCVVWEASQNGAKVTIWLWKGIELKTVSENAGISSIVEAVSIQENATVPFSKFEAPAGIKWFDAKTGEPIKE